MDADLNARDEEIESDGIPEERSEGSLANSEEYAEEDVDENSKNLK